MNSSSPHPNLLADNCETLKQRIYGRIRPDLERIEAQLNQQLTSSVPLIGVVGRYILNSGGKRLRPLLMILASRLCGYEGKDDTPLAVVFEFLHAASLLHDDVVDKAEVRRNHPAANTVWGNPAVVLVGDFLYSTSILMTVGYHNIRILEVLAQTTTRMAEGEVLQLVHSENLEIDEPEYLKVITLKTAILMSAACQIGAIFAGGDLEQEQAMRDYGLNLGIAFQLIDDTLDYVGDVAELGKPVGKDVQEGRPTLPLIYTMEHAPAVEREELKRVFSDDEISQKGIQRIQHLVTRTGGIDYTRNLAEDHAGKAKEALRIFPPHPSKDIFTDIADYVVCRRT